MTNPPKQIHTNRSKQIYTKISNKKIDKKKTYMQFALLLILDECIILHLILSVQTLCIP